MKQKHVWKQNTAKQTYLLEEVLFVLLHDTHAPIIDAQRFYTYLMMTNSVHTYINGYLGGISPLSFSDGKEEKKKKNL